MGRMRRSFSCRVSKAGAGRERFVEIVLAQLEYFRRAGLQKIELMKRLGLFGVGLFVVGMQMAPALFAADQKTDEKAKMSEKTAAVLPRAIPFQGNVVATDSVARTFTLNGKAKERVFKVNDQTEILIDNKQTQFGAITVGSIVRGTALKQEDAWETKRVSIGPKEPAAPTHAAPGSDVKK